MTVDTLTFRQALGRFASGVCIVTVAGENGRPIGVTISSFSSLSLQPPLVLFCMGKRSSNLDAWLTATHFSVNVLSETQQPLSELFASQTATKFDGVRGSIGENGCFRLDGALAILECRRSAVHEQGDHHILVGLVENVTFGGDVGPLLRFRGAYRHLSAEG